ncbi:MAG: hypothetical protein M3P52_10225 [Actinomycetota bacterium]|nr:hypothetical protein [Actinomycetota bacterium]
MLVGSGIADAGLGAGATPSFPSVVTVGATSVPAAIQLENNNTTPNTGSIVCNFGDAFPCPAGDPGITLIPSCGQLGEFSKCTSGGADPGVFQVSATATGDVDSDCPGLSFAVTLIDPEYGRLRFTPQPAGVHVVLPASGSVCKINFTFDVLKAPSVDQNSTTPGVQTVQVVDNTQHDNGSITASGRGTSNGTTVERATPTIATTASSTITVGSGQLVDSATVSGRVFPQEGATVDFRLYGPNDATCSGAPVFTSLGVPYPVAGGAVTSVAFTPTSVGTYRWVASYSGDVNNNAVSGACNDANETVTVSPATPTIATVASASITVGSGQLADSATVSGLVNPQPGATVDFRLYGPNDAICSGVPVFTSLGVPYPVAGGAVTSVAFTPTIDGDYRWVASYSGDVNNNAVSGACNDANETVTVSRALVLSLAPPPEAIPADAVLPATGAESGPLLLVAFGLSLTGCLLVMATCSPRRRPREVPAD